MEILPCRLQGTIKYIFLIWFQHQQTTKTLSGQKKGSIDGCFWFIITGLDYWFQYERTEAFFSSFLEDFASWTYHLKPLFLFCLLYTWLEIMYCPLFSRYLHVLCIPSACHVLILCVSCTWQWSIVWLELVNWFNVRGCVVLFCVVSYRMIAEFTCFFATRLFPDFFCLLWYLLS